MSEEKEVVTQEPTPAAEEKVVPGSKTPEPNLLAALHEERAARKELEDRLKRLETPAPEPVVEDVFSDEGKTLKTHIEKLNGELSSLKDKMELENIVSQHPELKEHSEEFNTYRAGYPGVSLEKAAKLFLHDKGLIGTERKGLERPSGGSKAPSPSGFDESDVKRMREENPRRYLKMVTEGKLKAEDIK